MTIGNSQRKGVFKIPDKDYILLSVTQIENLINLLN